MGLFIVFIIIIIYVALSQSVKQSNNQNRRGNNPAMGRPPQQIYRPQMNQPQRTYQQTMIQPQRAYQQAPAQPQRAYQQTAGTAAVKEPACGKISVCSCRGNVCHGINRTDGIYL